jgi:hypothetical protein
VAVLVPVVSLVVLLGVEQEREGPAAQAAQCSYS